MVYINRKKYITSKIFITRKLELDVACGGTTLLYTYIQIGRYTYGIQAVT